MGLSTVDQLVGLGIAPEPAKVIAGTSRAVITAAGTTVADATQLYDRFNYVSTVGGSTGVKLPNVATGDMVVVQNGGANNLEVYPPDAVQLFNAATGGQGLTLAAATDVILVAWKVTEVRWIAFVVAGPAT